MSYSSDLFLKVEEEFKEYKEKLFSMSPEEVYEHSYETAIKEDMLIVFELDSMPEEHAKALLKMQYPLEYCYSEWLEKDTSSMDELRDTIKESAKCFADYIEKSVSKSNKDSR